MQKITMADIAKEAGVSKTTVSRYFNGGYVKESTKEKLDKIIKRYNYKPNLIAASLKAKHNNVIGIVCPTLTSYTSSTMMMNIDRYLEKQHYTTIIMNTNHDVHLEIKSIETLVSLNVDAIILFATSLTMAHYQLSLKLDIPLLFALQAYDEGYSIINNDYDAGYEIGSYVGKKGHKNVLYMGVNGKDIAVGIIRKQGIFDSLENYRVKPKYLETDFSSKQAEKKIREYLHSHSLPSCIICATDTIALSCYKVIHELGYQIPDDISITGFGGYETSQIITPTLTTIRFHYEEAGEIIAKQAIELIKNNEAEKAILIDFDFIEGKSVKQM